MKSIRVPRRPEKGLIEAFAPGRTAHRPSGVAGVGAIRIGICKEGVAQFVGEHAQNRQFRVRGRVCAQADEAPNGAAAMIQRA